MRRLLWLMIPFSLFSEPSVEGLRERLRAVKVEGRIPCKICHAGEGISKENMPLYIFLSDSVPDSMWENARAFVSAYGGKIILCGKSQIKRDFPYFIDPNLFKEFGIERVPAFVLKGNIHADQVCGMMKVEEAMHLFKEEGDSNLFKRIKHAF